MDNNKEVGLMQCWICERGCFIPEGGRGACGMYHNSGAGIAELYPHRYLVACPISIETMPMLHFYPGGKFLQITTAGCNFNCPGCISTVIVGEMQPASNALQALSSEQVINMAQKNHCLGIAFLMNDPLASFLTFLDVAREAKKAGLLVGCSSNTYFTESSLQEIAPYLDFINIGIKGLADESYRNCGGSTVRPVLRNLEKLWRQGIHVEVSCIAEENKQDEITALAEIIAGISSDIPLQIMRFLPMEAAALNKEMSIREAEELVVKLKNYLNYVYLFNSPGTQYLNTFCPQCGRLLYRRDFYGPMGAKFKAAANGKQGDECPQCRDKIALKGRAAADLYQEGSFEGGYPLTRAMEMMEAILLAIGVKEKKTVVGLWEDVFLNGGLDKLHHDLQNPDKYLELIRSYGVRVNRTAKAEELASYIEDKIRIIKNGYGRIKEKPRVYYSMGKPLFAVKGERFENQMVELAGGVSVNQEIELTGRPGMTLSPGELENLNPDVIFISAFLSASKEDFLDECRQQKLNLRAIQKEKVYNYPSPGWDFGSPRWVLGLMYMANILHPEVYHFDLRAESLLFYCRFYNMTFDIAGVNRSFSKPGNSWQWQA